MKTIVYDHKVRTGQIILINGQKWIVLKIRHIMKEGYFKKNNRYTIDIDIVK